MAKIQARERVRRWVADYPSYREAAAALGISHSTLHAIVSYGYVPSGMRVLCALRDHCGVPLEAWPREQRR
jgi:hypothetical protein